MKDVRELEEQLNCYKSENEKLIYELKELREPTTSACMDYQRMYNDSLEQNLKLQAENEEMKLCIKHLALSINAIVR